MIAPRHVCIHRRAERGCALTRGVCRALEQLGYASLVEFPLANGRRADILALGKTGEFVIVEIKSSVADFRADRKWAAYRDFSDRLYFAVANDFPRALIPEECGLMVADLFGAAMLRDGGSGRLLKPVLDAGRCHGGCARIAALRLPTIGQTRWWEAIPSKNAGGEALLARIVPGYSHDGKLLRVSPADGLPTSPVRGRGATPLGVELAAHPLGCNAAQRRLNTAQPDSTPRAHLAFCPHRSPSAAPPARPRGGVARRPLTGAVG